jgi:zinc transport system substrate-binding protein
MAKLVQAIGVVLLGSLTLSACQGRWAGPGSTPPSARKLSIAVSILPQKYFVERIGDGHVEVSVMVPPGAEPHTFEPKPSQLKALSQAKAYLRIGIDFEKAWMDKFRATNPQMLIVDSRRGIQLLPLPAQAQSHANEGSGDEGGNLDPHIWLSPQLVKTQAQTIYQTLVKLDPEHQAIYQANLQQFLADLKQLDAETRQSLEGLKNRKFITFHPSWGYFARDYELEMISIEVGGQEPSAAELGELIKVAQENNIKIIFAEPQFSQQTARVIGQQIGGEVVIIDPLSGDWLNNFRKMTKVFAQKLSRYPIQPQTRIALHLNSANALHDMGSAQWQKLTA